MYRDIFWQAATPKTTAKCVLPVPALPSIIIFCAFSMNSQFPKSNIFYLSKFGN